MLPAATKNIMAIIISQNGKNAKKVERSQIEKEGYLQQYILDNPESIPLYDIKEDTRLLILIRELHTSNGPIDALGIDKEGNIYLIETKLFKNNDRRYVVAQVLDYGAALWSEGIDFSEFIRRIEEAVRKNFGVSLQERLKSYFEIEDEDVPAILESVSHNLNKGIFRFVVLMDKLHDELKDVILYLNENSRFDIYAVEIEYYKHENNEIMIPKLFGAEVKKDIAVAGSPKVVWTPELFFKYAEEHVGDKSVLAMVRDLYGFAFKNFDATRFGVGSDVGRVRCTMALSSAEDGLLPIFQLKSNGQLKVNFWGIRRRMGSTDGERYEKLLLEKLSALPAIKTWYENTENEVKGGRRLLGDFGGKNMQLKDILPDEKALEKFKSAILEFKKELIK